MDEYIEELTEEVLPDFDTSEPKETPEEVIYVVGESKKLVIQNFLNELKNFDIHTIQVAPSPITVGELPAKPINIIVCLSDDLDTKMFHTLKTYSKKYNWHIYFIRNDAALSQADEGFIKETSPFMFTKLPINMDGFFRAYNWSNLEKKRILVVDDDAMVLRQIQSLLQPDYEVFLVNSGSGALEFLDKHHVDLVLLDFEMPGMNGPSTLRLLRNNPETSKLPVIFLTAKGDQASVMAALQQKPNGYILKIRSPNEITGAISDFFSKYVVSYE